MLTTMLLTEMMNVLKMSSAEIEELLVKQEIKRIKKEPQTQHDVFFQLFFDRIVNGEAKKEIEKEAKCRLGIK